MSRKFEVPSGHLARIMQQFFDDEGWTMQQLGDEYTLASQFRGDNGVWSCVAWVPDDTSLFVFYSIFSEEIPEDRLVACSQFTCRANFGMLVGNFEIDQANSELRFRTSANLEGAWSIPILLQHLVYTNIATMDHYYPAIEEVVAGADVAAVLDKYEDG